MLFYEGKIMSVKAVINLEGKVGLVTGIANNSSIAYGCAKSFRNCGSELVVTYQNEKTKKFTEDLANEVGAGLYLPLDVAEPGQMEAVFEAIDKKYGKLDFVVHAMAFASKESLHGRVTDVTSQGLNMAMDVSCHSFVRMAKLAEPLMVKAGGGSLITMSYLGAEKVIKNYGVMGVVKAALEASVRYLAYELGPENIRVHAVSPGPLLTRAASGINEFSTLMAEAESKAPLHRLITPDEVGDLCAFLVSDCSRTLTGDVIFADGGYNIVG